VPQPAGSPASSRHELAARRWLKSSAALRSKTPSTPHAGELAFLFDNLPARYGRDVGTVDRNVARTFHRYVANFARAGDPNGAGLPAWPAGADNLLRVDGDGQVRVGADPWAARLDLVERANERPTERAGTSVRVAPRTPP
jgi:carboxylesterase type B